MTVAILSIFTGKYSKYFPFKQSIETHFLKNDLKHFFRFTDSEGASDSSETCILVNSLPWPLTTLMRFHYFEQIDFSGFDAIFYFDADTLVVDDINDDILTNDRVSAVRHPLKGPKENHFEDNPLSTAYVPANPETPYYQACFFGGRTEVMVPMFRLLSQNIAQDLMRNIIAKWHDESHFNHYLFHNPPKMLGEQFAFPDPIRWPRYSCSASPKIIHYNLASLKA